MTRSKRTGSGWRWYRWSASSSDFEMLPYEQVRSADNPEEVLLEFAQSTYEAAAGTASWDPGWS